MRQFSVLALALGLALTSPSLRAQTAPDGAGAPSASNPKVDEARARFRRGAELFHEGSFDAALAEFARAYQLAPNFRVLYNMAQVQVERHDYVAALRLFQDYLQQGGAEIPEERRQEVEQEVTNLKTRVAELSVTSNVGGAELSIDGVPIGILPLKSPLTVSSGVRRVGLHKVGYAPVERNVSVAGGDRTVVDLKLEPLPNVPAEAPAPSAARGPARADSAPPRTGMWVSIASTAVFAGAAVTFGALTQHADSQLDHQLSRYPASPGRIDDVRSRLKLYAALTDGATAAAGISALLAIYFVASAPRGSSAQGAHHSEPMAQIVPYGNGLALQIRF